MDNKTELLQLRDEINLIDTSLLTQLAKRHQLAVKVAKIKRKKNLAIRDIEREKQLLTTLAHKATDFGLDNFYITRLFQLIIEDSVLTQQDILQQAINAEGKQTARVAFLGPKGSYSHNAAHHYITRYFKQWKACHCQNFHAIFQAVETGLADYGILPLENTSSGSINEVYDLLQTTTLSLIGEIRLPIEHALLVATNSQLDDIHVVYSHSQPFQQCSHYLKNYPHWKIEHCESTASAMEKVASLQSPHAAALGNADGGTLYGLHPLAQHLANQKVNMTRFVVIARKPIDVANTVSAKTTLLMTTGQQSGALVDALLILKQNEITISKLESRPISGKPWEEMFYLDLQANLNSINVQNALTALSPVTRYLKVLGCYPDVTFYSSE